MKKTGCVYSCNNHIILQINNKHQALDDRETGSAYINNLISIYYQWHPII